MGGRDVKRIAMDTQGGQIEVLCTHDRQGWRISCDGDGMEAYADVPAECVVDLSSLDDDIEEEKREVAEEAEALRTRATVEFALWEWCQSLPGCAWGVYSLP